MNIKVAILDVGQGDTIIAHTTDLPSNTAVVIDCIDAARALDYLRFNGVNEVVAVYITHLHTDHYRQVCSLIDEFPNALLIYRCNVDKNGLKAFLRKNPDQKPSYERLERWAMTNVARVRTAAAPTSHLDGTAWRDSIEILHPYEPPFARLLAGDFNDISLIIKITGRGSSIVLLGDVQERGFKACQEIVGGSLRADFVKMPHHGAWNNPPGTVVPIDELLDAVQPHEAFVSVGTLNKSYGHPNLHVLESLKAREIPVRCTQATEHCLTVPTQVATSCAGDIIVDLSKAPPDAVSIELKLSHTATIGRLCATKRKCCS